MRHHESPEKGTYQLQRVSGDLLRESKRTSGSMPGKETRRPWVGIKNILVS